MFRPVFESPKSVQLDEFIFTIGLTGKNLIFFFMRNWQTQKILETKSQNGREKESIIMYWYGTRKFHHRTRIISSETRYEVKQMNYA